MIGWITYLTISSYCVVLLIMIKGNLRLKGIKNSFSASSTKVSILVPFRNEMNALPLLIKALSEQSYPIDLFEIVFIDDNSEDNSCTLVEEFIRNSKVTIKLFHLGGKTGKKEAIKKGVLNSYGDLIITTDADCEMNEDWLEVMVNQFESKNADLLIGPVKLNIDRKVSLQRIEFASLISCTSGSAAIKRAVACNGANLGFKKSIFLSLNPYDSNEKYASGDDIFLLHQLKQREANAIIEFVPSEEATVYTAGASSFSELINQRVRWAKKSVAYTDADTLTFGLILFFMNGLILYFLLFKDFQSFLGLFALKFILDFTLLLSANKWLKIQYLFVNALILAVVYPLYFLSFTLLSLFYRPKWKGREI